MVARSQLRECSYRPQRLNHCVQETSYLLFVAEMERKRFRREGSVTHRRANCDSRDIASITIDYI